MPDKEYDVSKRFQEVARRAQEMGPINTGPKKKKVDDPSENKSPKAFGLPNQAELDYATRPGRFKGPNSGKDVNLPLETGPKRRR